MNHPRRYFLDISPDTASNPLAPYAVLPIPYERSVSYGTGTGGGPAAILKASHEVEDFDEELNVAVDVQAQTLPDIKSDALNDEQALNTIYAAAMPVMKAGRFLLSLGGEHTITAPLVKAAHNAYGPMSVLQLDAHLDLRNTYNNSPFSHACVMRRVREYGVPTVHVGIRSISIEDHLYVTDTLTPVFPARDIIEMKDLKWADNIVAKLSDRVYITVDIDVFDPSLVPGTGTPEPGGLDWYAVTALLRRVIESREVVAADIVEVAPIQGTQVSEFVAARLGVKILTYHRHQNKLSSLRANQPSSAVNNSCS
ncbi:MAG: agmatinase [Lentisphaerae bacterium]|nr:agmatinase [Lentisphaerota bacterium]